MPPDNTSATVLDVIVNIEKREMGSGRGREKEMKNEKRTVETKAAKVKKIT